MQGEKETLKEQKSQTPISGLGTQTLSNSENNIRFVPERIIGNAYHKSFRNEKENGNAHE